MKKFLFLAIFLFCLTINTYNAFDINNCTKELKIDDLNSKNMLEYLKNSDELDSITKVCSQDICMSINPSDLERDIKLFIEKNINFLKSKGLEIALNAELKGFKIEKFIINSCY